MGLKLFLYKSSCLQCGQPIIIEIHSNRGFQYGSLLQYTFLENAMDRGAWRATIHGVAKSDTT